VSRVLDFIHNRYRKVLGRNPAVALCVGNKLIISESEFARTLSRLDQRSRTHGCPF
jgi:hypothetical protein